MPVMGERYLTMLEVSQKQAYIFSSNKLKDNIANSAVIAWIMDSDYFQSIKVPEVKFSKEENLVYTGGGHTVLEFTSCHDAREFVKAVTMQIHKDYDGIEVFACTIEYQENKTPGENLKELTKKLERKKSVRKAAFHQGSFGVEKISPTTLIPVRIHPQVLNIPDMAKKIDNKLAPEKYDCVSHFADLGGDKNHSNFIAVVHIDGNAMGKRLEELYEAHKDSGWEEYKKLMHDFSSEIDKDFKSAYKDMVRIVEKNLSNGKLHELKLKDEDFPVRRIITEGDDICFVSEGRIGLECAVLFLKALEKKENKIDHKGYAACAGVAIVHQKYPFYRAYGLAEALCSNAKKFGVSLDQEKGRDISAIDWHIEYGEIGDSIKELRRKYTTADGNRLEMRPYIVSATESIREKEPVRWYENFKKLVLKLVSEDISYARSKIKGLRTALKQGETQAKHFLNFNGIEDIMLDSYYDIFKEMDNSRIGTGYRMERPVFVNTYDGLLRSFLYDAVEMMDTYIGLEVEQNDATDKNEAAV